jgi:myo-inositol-1(or 4)-monophosphatase
MSEYLEVAIEAAREAAIVVRADFDRPKKISYKGEVDLVTETDRRSEAIIVGHLRKHFPSHAIVAEEGSEGAAAGAKYCWYVDPLDGTTNFVHGYPCIGISIALLEYGEPIAAAVMNPIAGELFTAAKGKGAHLNGKPMHVSSIKKLSESLVVTGFPTDQRKKSINMDFYWEFTLRSHGVRRDGSAALDLCSVACGRFEGFWEFGLKSWDTAGGILLVTEAGGKVSDFSGGEFHPGEPELIASNALIHSEMREIAAMIIERPRSA